MKRGQSSSTKRQPRVLIADSHGLFCAGLAGLLEAVPDVDSVVAATEVAEGCRLVEAFSPDVVLANPVLDDAGPFHTARRLHPTGPQAALMFLDDTVRELNIRAAIESHVEGYWTKCASFDQIRLAILDLAQGQVSFCSGARRYVKISKGRPIFKASRKTRAVSLLTPRQLDVMRLLVRGLSVKQCAQRLGITPNTVDSHKMRLMKTLGIHTTVELTRLAMREEIFD
jgi:DNA-binding NarL/FixJ family response regulator